MQHLRVPAEIGVEHVGGELERERHRVAVVVVLDVLAPVDRPGNDVVRVLFLVFVEIDDAITAVDLDDRRDQRDHVLADVADVRTLVDGEAIGHFHHRGRRAGFGGVNRAGDVVDRCRAPGDRVSEGVVHVDRARIGQPGEVGLVGIELRHELFGGDRDGDHLTAFLGRPDGEHLHPRRRLRQ